MENVATVFVPDH